jgi:hypothetical protein
MPEYFPGNPGRCTLLSGKSYEKMVQEKDPGKNPVASSF